MSSGIENCYLIETGYSFNTADGKEFHRGDYIPYWQLPVFCKNCNEYSAFNSAYRYSDTEFDLSTLLYGGLYLDFDDEEDFEKVRQDAITSLSYFKIVYKIPEDNINIYFSGKKGLHILIPPEVMGIEPNNQLNLIFKYIANSIKTYTPNKTIDLKIYDNKRLFRIPNTIHESTGLYKIPITSDELRNLSKDAIVNLAHNPRSIKHKKIIEANKIANTQYLKAIQEFIKYSAEANKDFRSNKTISFIPPCIQSLLDNGAEIGQRNMSIAILASFFKRYGKSFNEACDIISDWNSKNASPTGETELKRTVRSMYNSDKSYGCSSISLYTDCDCSNCKIKINKEKNKNENKDSKNKS